MPDDKLAIIVALKDVPIVTYVCKKTGIPRSTVYRWLNDDKGFKKQVEKAMARGRESICDMAEALVVRKIKEGHLPAATFFLKTFKSEYKERKPSPQTRLLIEAPPLPPEKMSKKQSEAVEKAVTRIFRKVMFEVKAQERQPLNDRP